MNTYPDRDRGPGCCGILLLAFVMMLLWNFVVVAVLHMPRLQLGYLQALAIILLLGVLGLAERIFRR